MTHCCSLITLCAAGWIINLQALINYLPDLPFLKESLAQLTPDFLAQSAETAAPAKSTFVLTTHNSSRNTYEKVYGTAITFYEEYDEALLTEEQVSVFRFR